MMSFWPYQHGSSACKAITPIQSQCLHKHQHGCGTRKTKSPIQSHTIEK